MNKKNIPYMAIVSAVSFIMLLIMIAIAFKSLDNTNDTSNKVVHDYSTTDEFNTLDESTKMCLLSELENLFSEYKQVAVNNKEYILINGNVAFADMEYTEELDKDRNTLITWKYGNSDGSMHRRQLILQLENSNKVDVISADSLDDYNMFEKPYIYKILIATDDMGKNLFYILDTNTWIDDNKYTVISSEFPGMYSAVMELASENLNNINIHNTEKLENVYINAEVVSSANTSNIATLRMCNKEFICLNDDYNLEEGKTYSFKFSSSEHALKISGVKAE